MGYLNFSKTKKIVLSSVIRVKSLLGITELHENRNYLKICRTVSLIAAHTLHKIAIFNYSKLYIGHCINFEFSNKLLASPHRRLKKSRPNPTQLMDQPNTRPSLSQINIIICRCSVIS